MDPSQYPSPPDPLSLDPATPQLNRAPTSNPKFYQRSPLENSGDDWGSMVEYGGNDDAHSGRARVLYRSHSTPSVAGSCTASPERPPLVGNPPGKKRNKLGYHRTSIACNHCRRRKIRCIVSSDPQNRCTNCIRLKKECTYLSVDQQSSCDARTISTPAIGERATFPSQVTARQQPFAPMSLPSVSLTEIAIAQTPGAESQPSEPETRFMNGQPGSAPYGMRNQSMLPWLVPQAPLPVDGDDGLAWRGFHKEPPVGDHFPPLGQATSQSPVWTAPDVASVDETDWGDMPVLGRSASHGTAISSYPQSERAFPMEADRTLFSRQQEQYTMTNLWQPTMSVQPGNDNPSMHALTGQTPEIRAGRMMAGVIPASAPSSWYQHQPHHVLPHDVSSRRAQEYGRWEYANDVRSHNDSERDDEGSNHQSWS